MSTQLCGCDPEAHWRCDYHQSKRAQASLRESLALEYGPDSRTVEDKETNPMKAKPKVRLYGVVVEAVERGTTYGVHRAFKHSDEIATPEQIRLIIDSVTQNVLNELCEILEL